MKKAQTLGDIWDSGERVGSPRLTDDQLAIFSEKIDKKLSQLPSGSISRGSRKEGRPKNRESPWPTSVRSIRLETGLWEKVAIEADHNGVSVNRWVENAVMEKLYSELSPLIAPHLLAGPPPRPLKENKEIGRRQKVDK